ncbi:GTPase HflX [Ruminococcus sp. YE282]|jgi:GTP-binding protein HflX|uniref:GTPase HflX n=1 Tax=Ruminococcus sp. YE282 TaxID=3158780 RepID=UPI000883111C|nr:GTPase HflX [Ruminococcus bromii]MEE3498803.1 GTPase HflX [Ruminococcus bromii]SCX75065.1 GTP-binding protein HflX [Ruminococcus bromii]
MELKSNEEKISRALLISVDSGEYDAEASLEELFELVKSAGAEPELSVMQKLDRPESATYLGSGKLKEIAQICDEREIDIIVADSELSPTQIKNIEHETDVRVIDRTTLILDIFAQRARSKEGKLQVELAQLKYMLPRLTGKGIEMSRLGGGIGTRGPGETKLETDKRHIRRRMETLKDELAEVEKHRQMLRKRRKKDGVVTCAIVGYTNAGKSTLMNYLTNAGVLAQDKLFATLDPTSRALKLPSGVTIMLIDTVGLVRRLPHHLVEAFRSTLEEAAQSDIIINLCDASSDEARTHLQVTKDLLESLNCGDTPIINVLNKCDLIADDTIEQDFGSYVKISAKTGEGIEKLLEEIDNNLPLRLKKVNVLIPFANAGLANEIRNKGTLLSEEYESDGIKIEAIVDEQTYAKIGNFEV